jgi:Cu-processing system permease protein
MFNIAINSFRELLRNRILGVIFLFACFLILFSVILSGLSLGQTGRIITDFGLAMIEASSLLATLFIGGQILYKEIEGKTIYLILSKPIARYEFIIGKFIGFAAMLLLIVLAQTGVLLLLMFIQEVGFIWPVLVAGGFIALKLLVVFGILLFFSTFSSPLLSIIATISIYVSAHATNSVLDLAMRSQNQIFLYGSKILSVLLPNFSALALPKNILGSPISVAPEFYITNSLVAIGYMIIILGCTVAIFSRKKFESV